MLGLKVVEVNQYVHYRQYDADTHCNLLMQ